VLKAGVIKKPAH